jgi:ATP-dependent Clp protease ATP-binding subunit ClpC
METAEAEARAFQHSYIGVEHLLLGLLREEKGIAIFALGQLGIGYEEVRTSVASILGQGDSTADLEISLTPRLRNVITQAREEARLLNHHYIGTEHLLLGLVQEKQGPAAAILVEDMDVTLERVAIHVYLVLGQALSLRLTRLYP